MMDVWQAFRKFPRHGLGLAMTLLAATPSLAQPQPQVPTERFAIESFVIEGGTRFDAAAIATLLQPFTGQQQEYADLQRATEALRQHYASAGYSVVWVLIPEQDLEQGVVRLRVIEGQIGAITIEGNRYFDNANILRSLPSLIAGTSPRASAISANVQLANESPAKQVDVVLRQSDQEGIVNAAVAVIDERPLKGFLTIDNTGNQQTGDYRLGLGIQHANLFNRDHVGTFNYVTSPGKQSQVNQISASYRMPLYSRDDSMDFIAAYSDVDAGTTQTVAGPLSFSGKGSVYGLRYNRLLERRGEYSHQLVYGFDYRAYQNTCSLGDFGNDGCGPAAVDVTVAPLSISYSGNWARPGRIAEFYVTGTQNLPGATHGDESDFNAARPAPDGNGGASSDYRILRSGGSIVQGIGSNWQLRAAVNAQYTPAALITGEQFGSAGATAVRGFLEREIARDIGYSSNLELYSPNLVGTLIPGDGNFRALFFYDMARTENQPLAGEERQRSSIASAGVGFRWNIARNLNIRFDMGRVINAGGSQRAGDYHGHLSLYMGI